MILNRSTMRYEVNPLISQVQKTVLADANIHKRKKCDNCKECKCKNKRKDG